ncbi:unnamed protein product [Aphanomyces euteiches]
MNFETKFIYTQGLSKDALSHTGKDTTDKFELRLREHRKGIDFTDPPTYGEKELSFKKQRTGKTGYSKPKSRKKKYNKLRVMVRDSKRAYHVSVMISKKLSNFVEILAQEQTIQEPGPRQPKEIDHGTEQIESLDSRNITHDVFREDFDCTVVTQPADAPLDSTTAQPNDNEAMVLWLMLNGLQVL